MRHVDLLSRPTNIFGTATRPDSRSGRVGLGRVGSGRERCLQHAERQSEQRLHVVLVVEQEVHRAGVSRFRVGGTSVKVKAGGFGVVHGESGGRRVSFR